MELRGPGVLIVVLSITGNLYAENIDLGDVVFANVVSKYTKIFFITIIMLIVEGLTV